MEKQKFDFNGCSVEDLCKHLTATSELLERATTDILTLLKKMNKLADTLPENEATDELRQLIIFAYEVCTFEDLASQHLGKVIAMVDDRTELSKRYKDNPLLNGPALKGDSSMSQDEIDNILNV